LANCRATEEKEAEGEDEKEEEIELLTVKDVTHGVLSILISVILFVRGGIVYSTETFCN
jgi:hypothetical protein